LTARGICYIEKNVKKGRRVAIFTLKGELVALGVATMDAEEMLRAKKGVVVDVTRVIMERGVYPRAWKK
jgi:predicted ribosome-associated RNA-binding protein Tma20